MKSVHPSRMKAHIVVDTILDDEPWVIGIMRLQREYRRQVPTGWTWTEPRVSVQFFPELGFALVGLLGLIADGEL